MSDSRHDMVCKHSLELALEIIATLDETVRTMSFGGHGTNPPIKGIQQTIKMIETGKMPWEQEQEWDYIDFACSSRISPSQKYKMLIDLGRKPLNLKETK
jgi:hypothetical protein